MPLVAAREPSAAPLLTDAVTNASAVMVFSTPLSAIVILGRVWVAESWPQVASSGVHVDRDTLIVVSSHGYA